MVRVLGDGALATHDCVDRFDRDRSGRVVADGQRHEHLVVQNRRARVCDTNAPCFKSDSEHRVGRIRRPSWDLSDTDIEWSDELLQPASNRHWLTRMLQNLLNIFGSAGQYHDVAAMLVMAGRGNTWG